MKRNLFFSITIFGIAMASCSANAAPNGYNVNVTLSPDEDGATAYITNFDNGDKIDSTIVDNGVAKFSGKINNPVFARLIVNGNRGGDFILEEGNINLNQGEATGTPLNDELNKFAKIIGDLNQQFRSTTDKSQQELLYNKYLSLSDSTMKANAGNPIGYYLFLQSAYDMNLEQLNEAIAATPSLGESARVKKLLAAQESVLKTSVGKKFTDFEIIGEDGKAQRLSDYVGKGKYVLVDFWASWCGPCIRETATIKGILNEYEPKGLQVLGVAVWDKPEDTKTAIKTHGLPWPQIINAGNIPTDLYGISGIPCIILFSPDGTILSRGKQGDQLKADVAEAMKDVEVPKEEPKAEESEE